MNPRIGQELQYRGAAPNRGRRLRKRRLSAGLGVLVLAGFALAGCGRLSLQELLESEQPGDFYLSPGNANLQVGRSLVVKANGGFAPYSYLLLTPGVGSFDPVSLVYSAPDSVADTLETVEIEAEDKLGSRDRVTLKIFTSLRLDPAGHLMILGDSVDLTAFGGVPDPLTGDYLFSYNGPPADMAVTASDRVRLTPSAIGSFSLGVDDSIGNHSAADILVVADSTLAISPSAAVVKTGGSLSFTAVVPAGHDFTFSTDAGSITPDANPATYTAPGDETVATVTLTDDDTSQSVTATVYVQLTEPEALYVVPSYTEVLVGEQVDLAAGGGLAPYVFSFSPGTEPKGTLVQTGPSSAVYTAPPDLPTRDQIMVEDAADSPPVYAVVKVSKK
jgi:hypothetical protein